MLSKLLTLFKLLFLSCEVKVITCILHSLVYIREPNHPSTKGSCVKGIVSSLGATGKAFTLDIHYNNTKVTLHRCFTRVHMSDTHKALTEWLQHDYPQVPLSGLWEQLENVQEKMLGLCWCQRPSESFLTKINSSIPVYFSLNCHLKNREQKKLHSAQVVSQMHEFTCYEGLSIYSLWKSRIALNSCRTQEAASSPQWLFRY